MDLFGLRNIHWRISLSIELSRKVRKQIKVAGGPIYWIWRVVEQLVFQFIQICHRFHASHSASHSYRNMDFFFAMGGFFFLISLLKLSNNGHNTPLGQFFPQKFDAYNATCIPKTTGQVLFSQCLHFWWLWANFSHFQLLKLLPIGLRFVVMDTSLIHCYESAQNCISITL